MKYYVKLQFAEGNPILSPENSTGRIVNQKTVSSHPPAQPGSGLALSRLLLRARRKKQKKQRQTAIFGCPMLFFIFCMDVVKARFMS
ncbi:hypothetical protein [Caproicibacter sp. BJN0012]|uniref:hypothetical protein n=1 Tax=Caproicibacter sp. BJN0012 TaxID=3110227 RepID=UPI002E167457